MTSYLLINLDFIFILNGFAVSALRLLVGQKEEHHACKKWVVGASIVWSMTDSYWLMLLTL